jgi:hypothetical protein
MTRLAIFATALLALSVGIYLDNGAPPRHHNDLPRMTRAINAMPLHPGWRRIQIDKVADYDCGVTILNRTDPRAFQAEEDTKIVARLVLAEMIRHGGSPARDLSNLSVTAIQDGLLVKPANLS